MNTTVPGASIRWQENAGKHVTLRAPEGSIAAQAASRHLHAIDRVVQELAKLLDAPPDKLQERVDVYLIDPLPEVPSALTGGAPGDTAAADRQTGAAGAGANGVMHVVQEG